MTNHLKMTMENRELVAPNEIHFDLFITSDGTPDSDVRLNSLQFGINFAQSLLPGNAQKLMQYLGESELPVKAFSFPLATVANHLRIVQSPTPSPNPTPAGGNGTTMVLGQKVKVGRFSFSASSDFNGNPDFTLQAAGASGKTTCVAVVWLGLAATTMSISATGDGNNQRQVAVL